jgi:hypothetical protein
MDDNLDDYHYFNKNLRTVREGNSFPGLLVEENRLRTSKKSCDCLTTYSPKGILFQDSIVEENGPKNF